MSGNRKEPQFGRRAISNASGHEVLKREPDAVINFGRRAGQTIREERNYFEAKGFAILTPEQALSQGGVPPDFSAQIKSANQQQGVSCSFRMSLPYQLVDGAPKPATVKAKTGNWGFTKGVIAVDCDVLGRVEKDGSIRQHTQSDFPRDANKKVTLPTVQHTISLAEVIQGSQKTPPEYSVTSDSKNPTILCVQQHGNSNQEKVTFSLDLSQGQSTASQAAATDKAHEKPSWWQEEKLGSFASKAEQRFPASYQAEGGAVKPLMVYALPDSKGQPRPITGDHDLLWITRKPNETPQMPPVFDSRTVDGAYKLSRALIEYDIKHAQENGTPRKFESARSIPPETIASLGLVTAAEAFTIMTINSRYTNDSVKNPIQHGCENRTPYKPQDLDGPMLHFYKGNIIMTKDEQSLANFLVHHPSYLADNIVDVHPQWKMQIWAPVIAKQIELQQEPQLSKDTLKAYNEYMKVTKEVENKAEPPVEVEKRDETPSSFRPR